MRERFMSLSWTRRVGVILGATYLAIGLVGFVVTAGVGFASTSGNDLIFFELNPLHNLVHLGIGSALLLAARGEAASKLMNRLIGGTYLLVAIVGTLVVQLDTTLFRGLISQRSDLNILALNHPDNLLHLASFVVLVGSTFIGRRRSSDSVEPEAVPQASAAKLPEVVTAATSTASRGDGLLWEGTIVPRSGTYRCACGQFGVTIKKGREFPNCPEVADVDHYYRLTRPAAKRSTRSTGTAAPKRPASTRARSKTAARSTGR